MQQLFIKSQTMIKIKSNYDRSYKFQILTVFFSVFSKIVANLRLKTVPINRNYRKQVKISKIT